MRARVVHHPQSPSPSSALGPLSLPLKRGAFPLTPRSARRCGARPVLPASFSTSSFPLPSEFQVNGSPRVEAATPHLLTRVHLSFLLPEAETEGLPGERPERGRARAARSRWGSPGQGRGSPAALPGVVAHARGPGRRGGGRMEEEGGWSLTPSLVCAGGPQSVRCDRQVSALLSSHLLGGLGGTAVSR